MRRHAHLKAGGTVYQASLRKELTQRLGVVWQEVHEGMADVAGFSPELLRHYSTRRQEVEEAVERYVAETGREAHPRVFQKFTLETRQPKAYPRGEAAVTQEMKDYGISTGIVDHWEHLALDAPEDVEAVVRNSVGVATPTARPVEGYRWSETPIVEEMADRRAVFTERDLLPGVAGFLPEGATPNELVDSARRVLEEGLESGRQLTRSVVQPPALAQGLAVEDATDQQLHQSLHNLEREIHRLDKTTERGQWIEDHAGLLHTYTAIKDELAARTTALAITYQLKPPADMLEVLGRRPSKPAAGIRWDTAVSRYAAARLALGPDADLTDLSTPEARLWQTAVDAYDPLPELEQRPTLKMTG